MTYLVSLGGIAILMRFAGLLLLAVDIEAVLTNHIAYDSMAEGFLLFACAVAWTIGDVLTAALKTEIEATHADNQARAKEGL